MGFQSHISQTMKFMKIVLSSNMNVCVKYDQIWFCYLRDFNEERKRFFCSWSLPLLKYGTDNIGIFYCHQQRLSMQHLRNFGLKICIVWWLIVICTENVKEYFRSLFFPKLRYGTYNISELHWHRHCACETIWTNSVC